MSRFCPACGRRLQDGMRFCVGCGKPVTASVMGAVAVPADPVAVAPSPAPAAPRVEPAAPLPESPAAPQDSPQLPAEAASEIPLPGARKPRRWLKIILIVLGALVAAFVGLIVLALVFGEESSSSWQLKSGQGQSLFAVTAPTRATLNLKMVAVACEIVDGAKVFHLQLYTTGGPLLPDGTDRSQAKDQPRVRLEIDGAVTQASLYFAGEFAVVANQTTGGRPVLTPAVGAALEKGRELTIRFDLVRDQNPAVPFDAYAVVNLAATGGASSIAAVRRRCGQ